MTLALSEKAINVEQLSLFSGEGIDLIEEEIQNKKEELYEEILFDIENVDVNNLTPLEALRVLNDLKKKLEENN